jgi:hypothetical protein
MGFSPGDFVSGPTGTKVHWEGRGIRRRISLWNADESDEILQLTLENARKARDQLALLVDMLEEDRL